MEKMEEFLKKFQFRPDGSGLVGVERECFLLNGQQRIVPIAPLVLEKLTDRSRFGYELSACQFEDRIGPIGLTGLKEALLRNEAMIKKIEAELNFQRLFLEVAPEDMPLDIYPDPSGRYQEITKNLPREKLLAACRVAAIHVHIGMPDHQTALKVYNGVITNLEQLCHLGDGSNGERLGIYKTMAGDWIPPHYGNWADYYRLAVEKKFDTDPRRCWHLIRISIHGTIEFRMFGSTPDLDKIISWATTCHDLCQKALI